MFKSLLIVLFTAMLPISELRGAIPLGLAIYELPVVTVYLTAVLGNLIPVCFLLIFWSILEKWGRTKFSFLEKLLYWLFERTRKRFYNKHKKFGDIALTLFVAVPLPVTGAWTGSLAAWLFGIPYKRAVRLIFLGVLISGLIVTLLTVGIIRLL